MLNRNINDLHPLMRDPVRKMEGVLLTEGLLAAGTAPGFKLFEGYRSPARQNELFRAKTGATTARAWQSAHQYGLAVDYVFWIPETGWSWHQDHPWEEMRSIAFMVCNLRTPLKWDLPHIEHPAWADLRKVIPR